MFKDREETGILLSEKIQETLALENVVVLGIARGGVVVASVIATQLDLPLGVIVIKKIGAPKSPEFSIGAVGPEKTVYWEKNLSKHVSLPPGYKRSQQEVKIEEQIQMEHLFAGVSKPLNLGYKTILLVDDGIATGATVLCAQKYLKKKHARVILVSPVLANDTFSIINNYFDMIIALEITDDFRSVGSFYKTFPQVESEEVISLLAKSNPSAYN